MATSQGARRRAVFLDRDGVLNLAVVRDGKPYPPDSSAELTIPEDVPGALQRLREAGYLLICCTNQPDVGRGTQTEEAVREIHDVLQARLQLDEILACFDPVDGGPRRKPNPGMLLEAADRYDIDLKSSFMVGDRWRDVEAGRRAGCTSIFIECGYTEPWPVEPAEHTVYSMAEAAGWILAQDSDNVSQRTT